MSIFVMTDIHGCYDAMNRMLEKVGFSDEDQLILAGDYIDRGPQSYEMLRWIEAPGTNVTLIRGNHDEAFAYYVELMKRVGEKGKFDWDSPEDTRKAYGLCAGISGYFDYYGTIGKLIRESQVCFRQLSLWAACIKKMPYYYWIKGRERQCVVVHAGYLEDLKSLDGVETEGTYKSVEEFWLNARDDAYLYGGVEHGMVIAGHTPTIARYELPYNHGRVYRFYDSKQDCIFYDLDCGYVFRREGDKTDRGEANMACMCVESEEIFYLK